MTTAQITCPDCHSRLSVSMCSTVTEVHSGIGPETLTYEHQQIADFMAARIVRKLGERMTAAAMMELYRAWCAEVDVSPMSAQLFSRRIRDFGVRPWRTNKSRLFLDVAPA